MLFRLHFLYKKYSWIHLLLVKLWSYRRCTCFFCFLNFFKVIYLQTFWGKTHIALISTFISILLFNQLHCKVFLHSHFFSMLDKPTIDIPFWSIHLLFITKFTESTKASNSVCFFCYLEFFPWFYVFVCSELLSLFYHCKFDFHTNSFLVMENVVERSSKMTDVTNRVDISINIQEWFYCIMKTKLLVFTRLQ